jgi:hypothetical protein
MALNKPGFATAIGNRNDSTTKAAKKKTAKTVIGHSALAWYFSSFKKSSPVFKEALS